MSSIDDLITIGFSLNVEDREEGNKMGLTAAAMDSMTSYEQYLEALIERHEVQAMQQERYGDSFKFPSGKQRTMLVNVWGDGEGNPVPDDSTMDEWDQDEFQRQLVRARQFQRRRKPATTYIKSIIKARGYQGHVPLTQGACEDVIVGLADRVVVTPQMLLRLVRHGVQIRAVPPNTPLSEVIRAAKAKGKELTGADIASILDTK